MEDWVDDVAARLDDATRDPMERAVSGTVRIVAASSPARRGRYQECVLEMVGEAPGMDPRTIAATLVFSTRAWPTAGMSLPARFSKTHSDEFEVDWRSLAP